MKSETKQIINQIVEYMKQDNEFPFDTHDEPEKILNYYKINISLKAKAKELLINEIKKLTEKSQTREIVKQIIKTAGW